MLRKKGDSMKKYIAMLLTLALLLAGCARMTPTGPQTLQGDGETYKTGFYGSLFPNTFELVGGSFEIQNTKLNRIAYDRFALFHADIGSYSEGTIYCLEKDYEDACAFYADPDNFAYYCILGVDSDTQSAKTVELSDVDTDQFSALLEFAEKSNYDPFDKKHNAQIEKVELPMPDDTKQTRLVFYKESNDHLFVSSKGTEFFILNGHLYAVYQYDGGKGEEEKLIAVKAPDDISTYFVEFMKAYL